MTRTARIALAACATFTLAACATDPQAGVPPPVAASGPSFSQTRDFIVTNLSAYGGYDWTGSMSQEFSDVHIDNSCTLSFTRVYKDAIDAGGQNDEQSGTITVPLGAVTRIENDENAYPRLPQINFYTGNVNAISMQIPAYSGSPATSSYEIPLQRTPADKPGEEVPDSAQHIQVRLKDALWHMVGMCKGRYVAKPKKPEPF